jgi:hypothetical protein
MRREWRRRGFEPRDLPVLSGNHQPSVREQRTRGGDGVLAALPLSYVPVLGSCGGAGTRTRTLITVDLRSRLVRMRDEDAATLELSQLSYAPKKTEGGDAGASNPRRPEGLTQITVNGRLGSGPREEVPTERPHLRGPGGIRTRNLSLRRRVPVQSGVEARANRGTRTHRLPDTGRAQRHLCLAGVGCGPAGTRTPISALRGRRSRA